MRDRPLFYILDEAENPVPVADDDGRGMDRLAEWLMSHPEFQGGLPQIAFDLLPGGGYVSTIFLTIDAAPIGPPRLWETMAFDGEGNALLTARYQTKAEALRGHALILEAELKLKLLGG